MDDAELRRLREEALVSMAKKNVRKAAIDDLQVLREAALISARQRVNSTEHKEELWQRSKRKLESPPKHHSSDSGNVTPKMYDAGGDVTPPHPLCDTPNDTPPRETTPAALAPKFTVKVGSHMPIKRSLSKELSPDGKASNSVIDSGAISPEPQFEDYGTVKKPSPPKKITIKLLVEEKRDQVKVPAPQSPSYSTITSDGFKSESDTEKTKEKLPLSSEDEIEQEKKLSKKSKKSAKSAKVKADKKDKSSKKKDKGEKEKKKVDVEKVPSAKDDKDKENGHVSKRQKKRHMECEAVKEKREEIEESPKKKEAKEKPGEEKKESEEKKEKKKREDKKEDKRDEKGEDKQEEMKEETSFAEKREDISEVSADEEEPEIVSLKTKRHYEQMKAEQNRTMPPKPKSKPREAKEKEPKDSSKSNGKSSSKPDKKSSKEERKAKKEMKISKKEERELLGETKEKKKDKFESVMKDEDSSSAEEASDNMDSLLKSNVDLSLDELVMKPKVSGEKKPRDEKSDKKRKDKKEKKEKKHKKKHKKAKDDEKSGKSEKSEDKKAAAKAEKKKKRRKESNSESDAESNKKPKVKIDKAELNKIVQFLKQRDEAQRESTSKGPFNPKILTKENKPIEIKLKTKPRR